MLVSLSASTQSLAISIDDADWEVSIVSHDEHCHCDHHFKIGAFRQVSLYSCSFCGVFAGSSASYKKPNELVTREVVSFHGASLMNHFSVFILVRLHSLLAYKIV